MEQREIDKIIEKYLKGEASSEEIAVLKALEDFSQDKIKDSIFKSDADKNMLKEVMFQNILHKKDKEVIELLTAPVKNNKLNWSWAKYAAAAVVVGALVTIVFKEDNLEKVPFKSNKALVITHKSSKTILPGTDKATLTLEDGTTVVLGKGNTYKTASRTSDGEQLVYQPQDKKQVTKIAYNYLTIPRGGQFMVALSDGTRVWLNSESKLKFPVNFVNGLDREVELLYGEAFFEVSSSTKHQGAKFKVFHKLQQIEVLGTQFNIKAYQNESSVYTTLAEGKVAIHYKGANKKLIPSEQSALDLNTGNLFIKKVNVKDMISWREGVFAFRGTSLKEIMEVISRWYDVDIVFKDKSLEQITFKGVLGKNQNLEEILETIKSLSVIKNYEINEKNIIIK